MAAREPLDSHMTSVVGAGVLLVETELALACRAGVGLQMVAVADSQMNLRQLPGTDSGLNRL